MVFCKEKLKKEVIPKACYEANRSFCQSFGDYSQWPWEDAPEWQKESVINGVEFALSNPDSNPIQMHNNWMKHKIDDGWVYGPCKDVDKKTHPCLVPYAELTEQHKAKDSMFLSIVLAFAGFMDGDL